MGINLRAFLSTFSLCDSVPMIGLDLGSAFIKFVQVESVGGVLRLTRIGSCPTPPEGIESGIVVRPEAVAQALRRLLLTHGLETAEVVTAVSGHSLVVRPLTVPLMSESQLRKSIGSEARRHIPFPLEDTVIEYNVVRRDTASQPPQLHVVLVAAQRKMADSRVTALEMAGLEPAVVEVEPFALVDAFLQPGMWEAVRRENVALVNIGASHTEITLVGRGAFALTRSVPMGGDAITREIADALEVDWESAKRIKEHEASAARGPEEAGYAERSAQHDDGLRARRSEIEAAVVSALNPLNRQVQQTFDSFQAQLPEGQKEDINRIALVGGTARLRHLDLFFQDRFGLPVQVPNLFQGAHLDCLGQPTDLLQEQAPLFAVSLGLGLREHLLREQEPLRSRARRF